MHKTPASLKHRLIALIIDYFIIVGYGLALLACTLLFYNLSFGGIPDVLGIIGPGGTQAIGFISLTLPIALYLYATESDKTHATFGKRAMKLAVASTKSGAPTKRQILIRTIVKLLPWEFAHTFVHQVAYYSQDGGTPPSWVMTGLIIANALPFLYVAVVLVRRDRRAPHDLAASTILVSLR